MTDLLSGMLAGRPRRLASAAAVAAVLALVASGAVYVGGVLPSAGGPASSSPGGSGGSVVVAPAYVPGVGVASLGPAPANTSLSVAVGLASRDPAGLSAFVTASEIPGTSSFHRFLSATAAAARFGAAPASVEAAEGYFAQFGLAATAHPDGLLLSVSGPVAGFDAAFGTTFDLYRNESGGLFVAHSTPATLPSIAPWSGVLGTGNVRAFVPAVRTAGAAPVDPAVGCPAYTGYLTPCEVATAYDYEGLDESGTNGSGETIAVIDANYAPVTASDFAQDYATFSSDFGLPGDGLQVLYPGPPVSGKNGTGTSSIWAEESELDIEWSHAAAPGASIKLVLAPNADSGLYYAIDWVVATHAADVISMSWGEPEVGVFNAADQACSAACNASSDGTLAILGPILELGAVEGISSFAASGDCGSSDGTSGVAVNYPASSPYVTGVGATNLTVASNGSYESEAGWGGNESGARSPGCGNKGGSGGGFSVLPRPSWQTGSGTVASRGRGVPDVAIVGGSLNKVIIEAGLGAEEVYGTSVGTPIWAGLAATADQYAGTSLGILDPAIYRILGGADYAQDFHDIVVGSNGYHAGVGWDPVTGVGSPIVASLLPDLSAGAAPASSLATSVFVSPRYGHAPLTVEATAAPRGGTATYPVQGVAFGDGNASTIVGGFANHTFTKPGVYSVQAYVVDSSGATAASAPVVVVVGGAPLNVSLAASSEAPAAGASVTFTASVTGGVAPYVYNFSFGDGLEDVNGSTDAVTHAYAVAGAYCAEVVVKDAHHPADGGASARLAIAVGGAAAPSCGNPTSPLTLVGNSSLRPRDAPADFPDLFVATGGSTAPNGLAPQVGYSSSDAYTAACDCAIFPKTGDYTVHGWENDTVNGEASAEVDVTVEPALSATFTASTLAGAVPLTVAFSAVASGGYDASAASTHWSFGTGTGETGASVSVTYRTPGEYVAIASLSDAGFGNASEAFVIDAEAAAGAAVGVTATITPAVNVSSGTTVDWNASEVGSAAALAGSRLVWDLGNGADAFGLRANETYYAATDLLAADTLAGGVSIDSPLLVPLVHVPIALPEFFATEAGGFVPAADALTLSAVVTPSVGVVPLEVNGTAIASGPGGVGVGWLFGDGESAVGTSVSHFFYGGGDYTVLARAYDGFGDVADRLVAVEANEALALAGCTGTTLHGTAPYTVELEPGPVGGTGAPYGYAWSLPGGGSSTEQNVTLTFRSGGTFDATVVVRDAAGTTASCSWTIVVAALPAIAPAFVLGTGAAAGLVLAGVFLWATRPRARRRPSDAPGPRVSP